MDALGEINAMSSAFETFINTDIKGQFGPSYSTSSPSPVEKAYQDIETDIASNDGSHPSEDTPTMAANEEMMSREEEDDYLEEAPLMIADCEPISPPAPALKLEEDLDANITVWEPETSVDCDSNHETTLTEALTHTKEEIAGLAIDCQACPSQLVDSPYGSIQASEELDQGNNKSLQTDTYNCPHLATVTRLQSQVTSLEYAYTHEMGQLRTALAAKTATLDRLMTALRDQAGYDSLQTLISMSSLSTQAPLHPVDTCTASQHSADLDEMPVISAEYAPESSSTAAPCQVLNQLALTANVSSQQHPPELHIQSELSGSTAPPPSSNKKSLATTEETELSSSSGSESAEAAGGGGVGMLGSSNSGPPLDTTYVAHTVRDLLSMHSIGQRIFAKHVLGLSQGTVSELLSKPKAWHKLTEKGRESYRRMHSWASDGENVLALKALTPRKGHVNFSPTVSVKEDQATEEKVSEILKEAKKAMANENGNSTRREDHHHNGMKQESWTPCGPERVSLSDLPLNLEASSNLTQSQSLVRQICYQQLIKLASAAVNPEVVDQYKNQIRLLESSYPELKPVGGDGSRRPTLPPPSPPFIAKEDVLEESCDSRESEPGGGGSGCGDSGPGGVKSATQLMLEGCPELNTDRLVRKIKDVLIQYSISQRLFGELVLGLSQGSVSDLLARPKPWNLLTHKGREPFIRMQLFLEDPDAITRLLSNQYTRPPLTEPAFLDLQEYSSLSSPQASPTTNSPADEAVVSTAEVTSPVTQASPAGTTPPSNMGEFLLGLLTSAQQHQQVNSSSNIMLPVPLLNPLAGLMSGIQLANQNAVQLLTPTNQRLQDKSVDSFPPGDHDTSSGDGIEMNKTIEPDSMEPLDTVDISNRVKELLQTNNLGQRVFGEAVLNLSQGSVSELLSKPKPWSQLSLKGREPFIRMKQWLADEDSAAALKRAQLDLKTNRVRNRGYTGTPMTISPATNTTTPLPSSASSMPIQLVVAPTPTPSTNVSTTQQLQQHQTVIATPTQQRRPSTPSSAALPRTPNSSSQPRNGTVLPVYPPKKPRIVFSDSQRQALIEAYSKEPYPRIEQLEDIAKRLLLPTKTVSNWFHNHRMRSKTFPGVSTVQSSTPNDSVVNTLIIGSPSSNDKVTVLPALPRLETCDSQTDESTSQSNLSNVEIKPIKSEPVQSVKVESVQSLKIQNVQSIKVEPVLSNEERPCGVSNQTPFVVNKRKRANPTRLYQDVNEEKRLCFDGLGDILSPVKT